MPTAVTSARQYLAGAAAAALDEGVSIARRRAHVQTTSLHVVSGLLSLPSSSSSLLRDALSRTRSAAHSPRFQFKALEVCFSLALDRLPSTPSNNSHPPVSNSLMAAIKRSQATQRRNPDTFHLYQHYQQHQEQVSSSSSASSSPPGVKVELQQLVMSILDDPIVSRVFSDAGFRSYDVKFAVLHPPPPILRIPRSARCPPLFLCNFSVDVDLASGPRLCADVADENCRRIGEILAMKSHRNPLLVGAGAADAALDFERAVTGQNWLVFPPEARGVKFFSMETDLFEYSRGSRDDHWLESRFREMELRMAEATSGMVLSFGDLKLLVDLAVEDDGSKRVRRAVSLMTKLTDDNPEKLWLIGSADTYETYMKFLSQYPSVDKDWDLLLLPISSPSTESDSFYPRSSSSYMESFVPFGGFFSSPLSSLPSPGGHCSGPSGHLHSDERDLRIASVLNKYEARADAADFNGGGGSDQARDDGTAVGARIVELKKKKKKGDRTMPQGGSFVSTDLMLGAALTPRSVISAVENFRSKFAESQGNGPVSSKAADTQVGSSIDNGDLKGFFRSVLGRVGRQDEAIFATCHAISRCRSGSERLRGSRARGDVWLSFLGADKFGKRKVAEALAEELLGCREKLVCVDLSSEYGVAEPSTVCGKYETKRSALDLRGKTLVDHVADELRRRPWSVLLLESIDRADVLVQRCLSQAIKTGKLYDSYGREVDINNAVFLTTACTSGCAAAFAEERILRAKAQHMKILIDSSPPRADESRNSCVFSGKRKLGADGCGKKSLFTAKPAKMPPGPLLDLNLPVQETSSSDTAGSENSHRAEAWMEEFLSVVDGTVEFREFNFDALADETLREIEKEMRSAFGFTFSLEIEPRIMDQILAAAWISEKGFLKNWLRQVLVRSLVHAKQSCRLSASSVVKVVAREEDYVDTKENHLAPEMPLPSSILPCEQTCHSFL